VNESPNFSQGPGGKERRVVATYDSSTTGVNTSCLMIQLERMGASDKIEDEDYPVPGGMPNKVPMGGGTRTNG